MCSHAIVSFLSVQDESEHAPVGSSAAYCQNVLTGCQVAEIDCGGQGLRSAIPGRRSRRVNDRLTSLVSELHRVQAVLDTNGQLDTEIEPCPFQMGSDWLVWRRSPVRSPYRPVPEDGDG